MKLIQLANKMEGWVKIYRQILESEIFANSKALKIFIWLILKANIKTRFIPLKIGAGDSTVKIEYAQLLFGRFKAEEELGIDGSIIYKWLKKMEEMQMIKIQSSNHYSIITICNFEHYQDINNNQVTAEEQQSNNQVTAEEQQSNTPKKVKKDKKVKKVEILFVESPFFENIQLIEEKIGEKYQIYNINYYYECVLNWSEGKQQRRSDWLATMRGFILRDAKDNKARLKQV
jgi:hypothetical protein